MTSRKQLDANRENAKKSTGPKTAEGKRRSAKNSTTHGLFTSGIVLDGPRHGESPAEFQQLQEALIADLEPEGAFEEMTVERIAVYMWRLRRLYRAEAGEIRAAALEQESGRDAADLRLEDAIATWQFSAITRHGLRTSVTVPRRFMETLDEVENEVKESGTLEEDHVFRMCMAWGGLREEQWFWPFPALKGVTGERGWEATASDPAERKRALLAAIEADRAWLKALAERAAQLREDRAADAAMVASIPPAETLDKLVRYEAHLERLLARALDQLFGSQRARSAAARDNVVEFDARKGSA